MLQLVWINVYKNICKIAFDKVNHLVQLADVISKSNSSSWYALVLLDLQMYTHMIHSGYLIHVDQRIIPHLISFNDGDFFFKKKVSLPKFFQIGAKIIKFQPLFQILKMATKNTVHEQIIYDQSNSKDRINRNSFKIYHARRRKKELKFWQMRYKDWGLAAFIKKRPNTCRTKIKVYV